MKKRPNYFVGIRFNNAAIHQKVKEVQHLVVGQKEDLGRALIDINKLHLTLAVTYLENESDIDVVKDKLKEWAKQQLRTHLNEPLNLTVKGINHFSGNVLYADLEQCKHFEIIRSIASEINLLIKEAGYYTDDKPFNPHITILKLSKAKNLFKQKRNFKEMFQSISSKTYEFGSQSIDSLDLLAMTSDASTGYYRCMQQISLKPVSLLDVERSRINIQKSIIRRRFHSVCSRLNSNKTGVLLGAVSIGAMYMLLKSRTK